MTFDEWFQSKQGTAYDSMYLFARDAWNDAITTEREACAKVAESAAKKMGDLGRLHCNKGHEDSRDECYARALQCTQIAADIRTRSNVSKQFHRLLYGGTCQVPKTIAVCPECGGNLHAVSEGWIEETGVPTIGDLYVDCENEESQPHRYLQSDWQRVRNAVEAWCGAEAV